MTSNYSPLVKQIFLPLYLVAKSELKQTLVVPTTFICISCLIDPQLAVDVIIVLSAVTSCMSPAILMSVCALLIETVSTMNDLSLIRISHHTTAHIRS